MGERMNRAERRRFEREFPKIVRRSGDNCGLCGLELMHNTKAYGGFDLNHCVVLVGECCVHRMSAIHRTGIYFSQATGARHSDECVELSRKSTGTDVDVAVRALHAFYSGVDRMTADTLRDGGVDSIAPDLVDIADSPWKDDDAKWFRDHPNRSHRLRAVYPGEAESVAGRVSPAEVPAHHQMVILVRQVSVGRRLRIAFYRNLEAPIPDIEELIHAIFDTVTQPGRRGAIRAEEVMALANRYSSAMSGMPN